MRIVRVRVEGRRPFTVRHGGRLAGIVTRLVGRPMITLVAVVFIRAVWKGRPTKPDPEDIAHESEHVEQWHDVGLVLFPLLYVLELLIRGYERNRFEVRARDYARANAHLFTDWDSSCSD